MGMLKIDHIRTLLNLDRVQQEFMDKFHTSPTEADVHRINEMFETELFSILPDFSEPIPGVLDTVETLRKRDLHIGSTTGYTKQMIDIVAPSAAKFGYRPDFCITSTEVESGRPAPNMMFANSNYFKVYPMHTMVKVGDTIADIHEGSNAGAWTVSVIMGSSVLGHTKEEVSQLSSKELQELKEAARNKFLTSGADFVIDSITDLPETVEKIDSLLEKQFRPSKFQSQKEYPLRKMMGSI